MQIKSTIESTDDEIVKELNEATYILEGTYVLSKGEDEDDCEDYRVFKLVKKDKDLVTFLTTREEIIQVQVDSPLVFENTPYVTEALKFIGFPLAKQEAKLFGFIISPSSLTRTLAEYFEFDFFTLQSQMLITSKDLKLKKPVVDKNYELYVFLQDNKLCPEALEQLKAAGINPVKDAMHFMRIRHSDSARF